MSPNVLLAAIEKTILYLNKEGKQTSVHYSLLINVLFYKVSIMIFALKFLPNDFILVNIKKIFQLDLLTQFFDFNDNKILC